MGELGDMLTVKISMGGMVQGFVQRMGDNTDGTGADIELTDINGIEHVIPCFGTP